MSLLTVQSNKRYAVRRPVNLDPSGDDSRRALLIEVSLEGCRISNLDAGEFETGQSATVEIGGFGRLAATVRWAHDAVMGLRFDPPLHYDALGELIMMCREEATAPN